MEYLLRQIRYILDQWFNLEIVNPEIIKQGEETSGERIYNKIVAHTDSQVNIYFNNGTNCQDHFLSKTEHPVTGQIVKVECLQGELFIY